MNLLEWKEWWATFWLGEKAGYCFLGGGFPFTHFSRCGNCWQLTNIPRLSNITVPSISAVIAKGPECIHSRKCLFCFPPTCRDIAELAGSLFRSWAKFFAETFQNIENSKLIIFFTWYVIRSLLQILLRPRVQQQTGQEYSKKSVDQKVLMHQNVRMRQFWQIFQSGKQKCAPWFAVDPFWFFS